MFRHLHHRHRFMLRYSRAFLMGIRRPVFVYLTILSLTMMGFFSALFYWAEGGRNPHMAGYLDSVYFVVTTMTGVGYGDITPVTWPGKILSMLMMLLGTAIFVTFTAVLATLLMELELIVPRGSDPD